MKSKEALDYLTSKVFTGGNGILETEAKICKEKILKDLERLEVLEKENQELKEKLQEREEANAKVLNMGVFIHKENEKLKKAIKENFMYIPDALFEKVCFKWTGPVMENEIIEVLVND